jgi:hypothetical protein
MNHHNCRHGLPTGSTIPHDRLKENDHDTFPTQFCC